VRVVTPSVLLLGLGNGRNLPPLLSGAVTVDALDDDATRTASILERFGSEAGLRVIVQGYDAALPFRGPYDGALSTHALLHGSAGLVRRALRNVAAVLRDGAPLHLVLGSRADPRYGRGRALGYGAFAVDEGSEAGVPHVYFDESGVREALGEFEIVSLEEGSAAQTAGRWAHSADESERIVHWFVRARKR
jgi:SAM-dependent methyltransferase